MKKRRLKKNLKNARDEIISNSYSKLYHLNKNLITLKNTFIIFMDKELSIINNNYEAIEYDKEKFLNLLKEFKELKLKTHLS